MAAWYLGKRIIPLFHLPEMDTLNDAQRTLLRRVQAEDQGIELRPLIDAEGRLDFGPWEQIFYGEFDGRRRKRVLVKVIGV